MPLANHIARLRSRKPCDPSPVTSYQARTARLAQPSAFTPPSGPLAFTTPIGHDTPVPWSGQYPFGFLLSDRHCWWWCCLSELARDQSCGDTTASPASLAAVVRRMS